MKTYYLKKIKKRFSWIITKDGRLAFIEAPKMKQKYFTKKFLTEVLWIAINDRSSTYEQIDQWVQEQIDELQFEKKITKEEAEIKILFDYMIFYFISEVSNKSIIKAKNYCRNRRAWRISKRRPVRNRLEQEIYNYMCSENLPKIKILPSDEQDNR